MRIESNEQRRYAPRHKRQNKKITIEVIRQYAKNPQIEIVYDHKTARQLRRELGVACLVWNGRCAGSSVFVFKHAKQINIFW